MLRPQFSIQTLLLGVTFFALCLSLWKAAYPWYRQEHGSEILSYELSNNIRNGDSIGQVAARLGVEGVDIENEITYSTKLMDDIRERFAGSISGLITSDQVLVFDLGKSSIALQFREGNLINHDPSLFPNVDLEIRYYNLGKTPIGSRIIGLLQQIETFHIVAAILALLALSTSVMLGKPRGYSITTLKYIVVIPVVLCTAILCIAIRLEPVLTGVVVVAFIGMSAWNLSGRWIK